MVAKMDCPTRYPKDRCAIFACILGSACVGLHRIWCLSTVQLEFGPVHYWFIKEIPVWWWNLLLISKHMYGTEQHSSVQFNHVTFISFYILLCTAQRHRTRWFSLANVLSSLKLGRFTHRWFKLVRLELALLILTPVTRKKTSSGFIIGLYINLPGEKALEYINQ